MSTITLSKSGASGRQEVALSAGHAAGVLGKQQGRAHHRYFEVLPDGQCRVKPFLVYKFPGWAEPPADTELHDLLAQVRRQTVSVFGEGSLAVEATRVGWTGTVFRVDIVVYLQGFHVSLAALGAFVKRNQELGFLDDHVDSGTYAVPAGGELLLGCVGCCQGRGCSGGVFDGRVLRPADPEVPWEGFLVRNVDGLWGLELGEHAINVAFSVFVHECCALSAREECSALAVHSAFHERQMATALRRGETRPKLMPVPDMRSALIDMGVAFRSRRGVYCGLVLKTAKSTPGIPA